mgnify:FL=1
MSKASLGLHDQLPITSDNLLTILKDNRVEFKLYKHKPLYSVSESKIEQELIFPINSNNVHIKNLYLRDKKKRNYLITCEQDKNINLKALKKTIKSDRLSFGSPDRLFQHLGVFPGAVSPFCMLNGIKNDVKFFCDYDLKQYKKIYLHPFVNDMSVCLNIDDLENFLKQYHISIIWVNL